MSAFLVGCNNVKKGEVCRGACCAHKTGHEAETVNTVLATPYYYQDVISKENELPKNGVHSIRIVKPNGTIHTKIQHELPSLGEPIKGNTYTLVIDGTEFSGNIARNTISTENNRNESARRIATTRTNESPTLWVPLSEPVEILGDQFTVDFNTDVEEESITVQMTDIEPQEIKSRNLRGFIQRQIKLKGYDPKTHSAYIAQNMRFIVENKTNTLKDVEVVLEKPVPMAEEVRQFTCDPANIDHVTGLVMALEDHIPEAEDRDNVTALFNTINEHRIQLEKDQSYVAGPTVNAAIHEATELLWNNIGLTIGTVDRDAKKILKTGGQEYARSKADRLAVSYFKLKDLQDNSKGPKAFMYNKRRQVVKKQLENLRKSLNKVMAVEGLSDTKVEFLRELTNYIDTTLRGQTYEEQYKH